MSYNTEIINQRLIIRIDYSGLKPQQMISLFDQVQSIILGLDQEVFLLVNFARCYVDHQFNHHSKAGFQDVQKRVAKIAFIGLNFPKYQMMNAYAFLWKVNFRAFDNPEDAITYLLE